MEKRIRYEYSGTIGMSRHTYKVNGVQVRVFLDTESYKFEIIDEDGVPIEKGGNSKKRNLRVLKRQAKRALEKLGVEFEAEERSKENKNEK